MRNSASVGSHHDSELTARLLRTVTSKTMWKQPQLTRVTGTTRIARASALFHGCNEGMSEWLCITIAWSRTSLDNASSVRMM